MSDRAYSIGVLRQRYLVFIFDSPTFLDCEFEEREVFLGELEEGYVVADLVGDCPDGGGGMRMCERGGDLVCREHEVDVVGC